MFHTVDHVEGTLDEGFDSLDAFLIHMWAVTVIGAPKKAAAQAIENLEKDARGWYGGAVGMLSLNGDINTGILIRTVHLKDGIARYPVGATLLYDSVPAAGGGGDAPEGHRVLPRAPGATAEMEVAATEAPLPAQGRQAPAGRQRRLLHPDAGQLRAPDGRRGGHLPRRFPAVADRRDPARPHPDLAGSGPSGAISACRRLVRYAADAGIPVFGVCLGLQGIVEAFGGELGVLDYPMHGKPSWIEHRNAGVFEGLPARVKVGRYHSLYASRETLPASLEITAETDDGVIMGVRHRELPIEAVQFHPESLLSLDGDQGLAMIRNMITIYGNFRKARQTEIGGRELTLANRYWEQGAIAI